MDTKTFLNKVTQTMGKPLRRKFTQYFDKIAIATGTTNYTAFTTSLSDNFSRNKKLPLASDQIFALTHINLFVEELFNTTALYADLLLALQQSYLEIVISSRQKLKIPLYECLSFVYSGEIGNTTTRHLREIDSENPKPLAYPLVFNGSQDIQVNIVLNSTLATDLNAINLNVLFTGIQSDILDPAFVFNPILGNQLEEIAYTMWNTLEISTANQKQYSLFSDQTLASNFYSKLLPLSNEERFEVQAIEIFFGGKQADTDYLNLLLNDKIHNYLTIKVNDVEYYQSNLKDILSLSTCVSGTFKGSDNSITHTVTELSFVKKQKVLEIPIVFPSNGLVTVTLDQPGSSLSVNQYFTLLLKGKLLRQIN